MGGLKVDKNDFVNHFLNTAFITESAIRRYLEKSDVNVNESTLRWHIHQLKESNVLIRIKPGVYTLANKSPFEPIPSSRITRIYNRVTKSFSSDLPCTVWSTEWLHQFMVLQPTQHMIIFETEKPWTESLFHILKDAGLPTFLNPSKQIVEQYITGIPEAFIVKPLVSRAPVFSTKNDIQAPSLEKILVDLIHDADLFTAFQDSELENIFTQAWRKYSLNFSVLINYAKRRRRLGDLVTFTSRLPNKEIHEIVST